MEWNEKDNGYETADTRYNADGGIVELEDDDISRTTTDKNNGQDNGKIP